MKNLNRKPSFLFICLLIIITILVLRISLALASNLNLNVNTDSPIYSPGSLVTVSGNATLDGEPLTDGLVGIEILDPNLSPFFFRTLKTGEGTQVGWIRILDAYTSDNVGNPKTSFRVGNPVYVTITVENMGPNLETILVTVSLLDHVLQPLGISLSICSIPSQNSLIFTFSIPLPEWAANGSASAFISLFTDFPGKGGVPYCEEKPVTFQIESPNIEIPPQISPNSTSSMFTMQMKIPKEDIKLGNYTLCYSMGYQGLQSYGKTIFKITITGDIDGDGKVNYKDLFLLAAAYGSSQGEERYNRSADLNSDGKINYQDLFLLAANYGMIFGEGGD